MFRKILIANRGEIACRIIRTAHKMGIATVAVHSDADAGALHVRMADEAVPIGGPAAADSYLRADRLLAAVRDRGAEALHPGYGFLSENAEFAKALAEAGAVFIGPGERAILSMGDKIASKRIAQQAGVPTIPGGDGALRGPDQAVQAARQIGYPAMLKASAGGGGKGMRVVRNDAECREGFLQAASEAKSSFGDERVFAEKFIERPRHIEMQVLADGQGNVVHLGERECSIQRRHQKVIEESPSPFLDADTRQAMGEQAKALARAVGYRSAGTVEFIVDAERNFYFLEMNTRLQVEHPVTEMVVGVDLVELMIRVAAGEPLPFTQEEIVQNGWAIEARVCAEDPRRGFLPSIGRLMRYRPPAESAHVRVDTGIEEGSEVSMFYDPMIAKLVTWGASRQEAMARMNDALDAFCIRGPSHNIGFLNALIAHPRFRAGNLSTGFIAEEYPDGFRPAETPQADPLIAVAVAAAVHCRRAARAAGISGRDRRFSRPLASRWVILANDRPYPVEIQAEDRGFAIRHKGETLRLETDWRIGDLLFRGKLNGALVQVQVELAGAGYRLLHRGAEIHALALSPEGAALARHMLEKAPPDQGKFLLSPMPGLLVRLAAAQGDAVKAGEELAVVEAMKMENSLRAAADLQVKKVLAQAGDRLEVNQPILEFE